MAQEICSFLKASHASICRFMKESVTQISFLCKRAKSEMMCHRDSRMTTTSWGNPKNRYWISKRLWNKLTFSTFFQQTVDIIQHRARIRTNQWKLGVPFSSFLFLNLWTLWYWRWVERGWETRTNVFAYPIWKQLEPFTQYAFILYEEAGQLKVHCYETGCIASGLTFCSDWGSNLWCASTNNISEFGGTLSYHSFCESSLLYNDRAITNHENFSKMIDKMLL